MKTTKLIIGIISMVLFCVIAFQSCAAGISNAIDDNDEISGAAGFFLAVCLLIAGILCVVMRKGISGGFVASGFYLVGGLVGLLCFGTFADLQIWSVISLILGSFFLISSIVMLCLKNKNTTDSVE